jgi:phosphatidylinositol alpha-1,6-mannosyltransferase
MERLVFRASVELGRQYEVLLLGPEGCEAHARVTGGVWSCPLTPLPRFLASLQWKASWIALRHRPDLVLAGSGLAAAAARSAGTLISVPVLCYLHGLDLVAPSLVYRRMFLPMVRHCDVLIANSRNTARLIEHHVGRKTGVHVLHPGVECPVQSSVRLAGFRQSLGVEGRRLLLSVGRLSARKGLAEFVERVLPLVVQRHPEVVLAVVGGEPRRALHSRGGERGRIDAAIERSRMQEHVLMLGTATDDVLAQAYHESDLLIFPARDLPGDVEGFGMVALEAAAHGLPTVAYAVGGIPDAVSENVSGHLVPADDHLAFAQAIIWHLEDERRDSWRERCMAFAEGFAWERFGTRLREICAEAIAQKTKESARGRTAV